MQAEGCVNIKKITYRIVKALLAVLFVLTVLFPGIAMAAAEESPIQTGLSEIEITDKDSNLPAPTIEVAVPPSNPQAGSGNASGGNANGGNADAGSANSGSADSGGANSGDANSGNADSGNANGGDAGSGNADSGGANGGDADSGNANSGNANSGDADSGNANTGGAGAGQSDSGNANSGEAGAGNVDPGEAGTGNSETGEVNPPATDHDSQITDAKDPNAPEVKDQEKSWFDKLKDKVNDIVSNPGQSLANFGKGLAGGAIGAAAVIIVVVAVALIISAPISIPVLIVAGIVGVVAGGVYGLLAGDDFSFLKSIGYGAVAAISVIGIARTGIVEAGKGVLNLFRTTPFKSAITQLATRVGQGALNYFKGLGPALYNGARTFFSAPLTTLRSAIVTKEFGTAMLINFVSSYASKLALKGEPPSPTELLASGFEALAATVLFDKIAGVMRKSAVTDFGKSVSTFFSGMLESIAVSPITSKIKGEDTPGAGEQARDTFFGKMVAAPLFSTILGRMRINQNIGTTTGDLDERNIRINVRDNSSSRDRMTNRHLLERLWRNTHNQNTVDHWLGRGGADGGVVSREQFNRLTQNQSQLDSIKNPLDTVQKMTEEGIKELNNNLSKEPDSASSSSPQK